MSYRQCVNLASREPSIDHMTNKTIISIFPGYLPFFFYKFEEENHVI